MLSCDDSSIFALYFNNGCETGTTTTTTTTTTVTIQNEDICVTCESRLVRPMSTIGDIHTPCSASRRVYIRQGQSCAICLDGIWRRSDAWLLSCGHGFHFSCLKRSFDAKMAQRARSVFRCPLCRVAAYELVSELGLRYDPNSSEFNGLDALENAQDGHRLVLDPL